MKWVFHIGYPKCASSTIQRILRESEDIFYCGKKAGSYEGANGPEIVRTILATSNAKVLPMQVVNKWRTEVEAKARALGYSQIVFSDELFLSTNNKNHPIDRLNTLYRAFGTDLEIRIVLRNHWSLLKSNFRQKIKTGSPLDYETFAFFALLQKHTGIMSNTNFQSIFKHLKQRKIPFRAFLFERLVSDQSYMQSFLESMGVESLPSANTKANISPTGEKLAWILEQNRKDYEGRMGKLSWTGGQVAIHEIDRQLIMEKAKALNLQSPIFEQWLIEAEQSIAQRQARMRNAELADSAVEYNLSPELKLEMERVFRNSCRDLCDIVGESCLPFGYHVKGS